MTYLDRRNHPILIHCNKGKHRTGCLVGVLRRLQHWSFAAIFDEYRRYSNPKSRTMDMHCIELFDLRRVWERVQQEAWRKKWLPRGEMIREPWVLVIDSSDEDTDDTQDEFKVIASTQTTEIDVVN